MVHRLKSQKEIADDGPVPGARERTNLESKALARIFQERHSVQGSHSSRISVESVCQAAQIKGGLAQAVPGSVRSLPIGGNESSVVDVQVEHRVSRNNEGTVLQAYWAPTVAGDCEARQAAMPDWAQSLTPTG